MGTWQQGKRPITIAILAMGGEGGGVLSNWIADVATRAGYIAQTTQVAGVAQRTGATVYYVELYPPLEADEGGQRREPVLSMFPIPGECDIVIASELMEAGRSVQRGFVTPDRTTFIVSTNRVYSIDEKTVIGDGRVDSETLIGSARAASKRFVGADFMAIAEAARSVVSASLFGALAGSEALPFDRELYEQAIADAGKGVEQSLDAFARGFATAAQVVAAEREAAESAKPEPVLLQIGRREPTPEEIREEELQAQAVTDPGSLIGPNLQAHGERIRREFPAAARLMLVRGCLRTGLYQSPEYAMGYLDRVKRLLEIEPDAEGEAKLTYEAARHVALLLTYQDTIHVALQKIRAKRLADIRAEARATDDQLVDVYEYLHPDVEEVTDTMPSGLGSVLRNSGAFGSVVRGVGGKGIVINTTSVAGYATLVALAKMRPMRPTTMRFKRVQREVDEWLDLALRLGRQNPDLAREVIQCAQVVKGYGDTHERGMRSFVTLQQTARRYADRPDAAELIARLRQVALAEGGPESLETAVAELAGEGVDGAPETADVG
ncbi:indolepyruvate oxidoreductase subunit beta family protein [Enemella sp. A6]|uniref:indolepyruvate oxidoreductase subunit beta family protein n=1 Tax=Enemella sp. A6 TaxID=3440152 RepID=UPI003EBC042F